MILIVALIMPKVAVSKKAYSMAKPLHKGLELEDQAKGQWVINDVIGQGGFGRIYSGNFLTASSKPFHFLVKCIFRNLL